MQKYTAKLKTRKALEKQKEKEGYTDAWGWWVDVCPGKTLVLRDSTKEDLERCYLREGSSQNPDDWLCETFERGALVSKSAIEKLTPLTLEG